MSNGKTCQCSGLSLRNTLSRLPILSMHSCPVSAHHGYHRGGGLRLVNVALFISPNFVYIYFKKYVVSSAYNYTSSCRPVSAHQNCHRGEGLHLVNVALHHPELFRAINMDFQMKRQYCAKY